MLQDSIVVQYYRKAICLLNCGAPIGDLLVRLWVANVFWKAGLTKIANIDTTMYLFQYEYAVPIIPFELAAYMAIFAELAFPILLVVGFATRLTAGALFVFNFVAVISYPTLNAVGIAQHQVWGILLLIPLLHGPGAISLDHFIKKWYSK